MVSLQQGTLCSRKREVAVYREEFHGSFKKRKHEDQPQGKLETALLNKGANSRSKTTSTTFDVDLHLRTPLTLDWQLRLDSKGQSNTSEDHRTYPEEPASSGGPKMSLDLGLNLLPSDCPDKNRANNVQSPNHKETNSSQCESLASSNKKNTYGLGLNRCPLWLALEGEDDDDQKKKREMVTTVCTKCHMLVMLCKSAPVCPNCKFMHPLDHSSMDLFKPSSLLSLLC